MTMSEFTKLVADMRHAQKNYFRLRSGPALEESKRLEKAVDKALAEFDQGQRKLFGEDGSNAR